MGFYGYRGGFGRFGYVGDPIVGDIGFDEQWSRDDWTKNNWGSSIVGYLPLGSTIIDKARAQWAKLKDLVENQAPSASKAQARMDKLRNDLNPNIAQVDNITRSHDYGGAQAGTAMRITYYGIINQYVQAFANENWPTVDADMAAGQAAADAAAAAQAAALAQARARADMKAAADAKVAADAAAAVAKLQQTQEAIQAAKDAIAAAEKAKAVAAASTQAHKEAQVVAAQKAATAAGHTPFIVAGGLALAAAAAVFLARRGGSKRVAGYRRRRR